MDISALSLQRNPFAMKVRGPQQGNPFQVGKVEGTKPTESINGASSTNPFGGIHDVFGGVGLGIQDGTVHTSAAQMGKKPMPMRQLGIA